MGTIVASFHLSGNLAVLIEQLNRCVNCSTKLGITSLRILLFNVFIAYDLDVLMCKASLITSTVVMSDNFKPFSWLLESKYLFSTSSFFY